MNEPWKELTPEKKAMIEQMIESHYHPIPRYEDKTTIENSQSWIENQKNS